MTIPTIAELEAQIVTAIEGKIGQTIPTFVRAFFRILAKGLAGVLSLVYRFASWCLDQTQPATANEFWLTIWGNRYGVTRSPSVAARLTADATGTEAATIPAGTLWQTSAGVIYSQESEATIVSGTASITIKCLTNGEIGNLEDAVDITTVSPVVAIDNAATITDTLTTGEERQALESFRSEVMNRIAYRPQGGAIGDYVIWALEVNGIVAAFVAGGGGDVNVYPLVALTGVSRVPGSPKLTEVQDYLNDPVRKIIGATPYALSTTERTCAVTITGATIGGSALSAGQKTSVESAITSSLYDAYPSQYPDQVDKNDTISVAIAWNALLAIGATATDVTINISGIGGGPYTLPIGEIIGPGVYTWA